MTLAVVPSGPVFPYQQFPVLRVGITEMPPWSHQKSTPFRWTLPFGSHPHLVVVELVAVRRRRHGRFRITAGHLVVRVVADELVGHLEEHRPAAPVV